MAQAVSRGLGTWVQRREHACCPDGASVRPGWCPDAISWVLAPETFPFLLWLSPRTCDSPGPLSSSSRRPLPEAACSTRTPVPPGLTHTQWVLSTPPAIHSTAARGRTCPMLLSAGAPFERAVRRRTRNLAPPETPGGFIRDSDGWGRTITQGTCSLDVRHEWGGSLLSVFLLSRFSVPLSRTVSAVDLTYVRSVQVTSRGLQCKHAWALACELGTGCTAGSWQPSVGSPVPGVAPQVTAALDCPPGRMLPGQGPIGLTGCVLKCRARGTRGDFRS